MDKVGHPRLRGAALVFAITSVCSFGFWLFGYDQGVMSGVVVSQPWLTQMGNPSTVMIGTITSLYDVGAVVGALAAASNSERLGRKRTLILGAVILIVGSVLMSSAFERIQIMVARVIAGIGKFLFIAFREGRLNIFLQGSVTLHRVYFGLESLVCV